jgi:hypothetical protein
MDDLTKDGTGFDLLINDHPVDWYLTIKIIGRFRPTLEGSSLIGTEELGHYLRFALLTRRLLR